MLQMRERATAYCLALAMSATLVYVYLNFIAVQFYYIGYTARDVSPAFVGFLVIVAPISAMMLPVEANNPSQFMLSVLYYFLILPSLLIPPLHGYLDVDEGIAVFLLVLLSFLIMIVGANTRTRIHFRVRIPPALFWAGFAALWVGLNLFVLSGFSGTIRFVGFEDIYAQRELAMRNVTSGGVWYASGFLANALNPFLMSLGIATRRWRLFGFGLAGQVFLFTTAAQKVILVTAPLLIVFFIIVFSKNRFSLLRVGVFSMLVSVGFLPMLLLVERAGPYEFLLRNLVSLVYLRTFCTTGAMLSVYADYFSSHPWTYFSHSMAGSSFSIYPYDADLGEVIGEYMTGGLLYINANAGFFATDGFASLGALGVPIIAIIVAAFFSLVAMIFGDKRLPVVCGTLIPYVMGLSNSSFFTSLLTGGGGVAILLLIVWRWSDRQPQALQPI